jgi:hypothetical protein
MPYQTIQPPFTLKFHEMSKEELNDYARWFHGIADERISELEKAVQATPGYESWTATFKPESLEALGSWFAKSVETRPRTPDEMAELKLRGEFLVSGYEVDLTNRSFSIAFDVAMYLARTFEHRYPDLVWQQFLNDKRFADYGQPVLTGFGNVPLNPVRIAVTLAYGLASGKQSGNKLREIYAYWSDRVSMRRH